MNIILKTITGKEIPIIVESKSMVKELKEKICKEKGIKEYVKLVHDNVELESYHNLYHYGITNGTTIQILVQPKRDLNIMVKSLKLGEKLLRIADIASVKDIRTKLKNEHKIGILAELHDICLENGEKINDEHLPLHFFGITEGSVLQMRSDEEFRIRVSSPRRSIFQFHFVPVNGTTGIESLKKKIVEAWDLKSQSEENPKPWNTDYIVLFLKDEESFLEIASNDNLTVKDYKLKHNDMVHMLAYDKDEWFQIRYCNDYRRIHGIRRSSDFYSILSLKLAIQDQLAIPVIEQIIRNKEGNILGDNDFAKDANDVEVRKKV